MQRIPVVSSTVADVGFDPTTSILEVGFRSGTVYQYYKVSADTAHALANAASVGRYLAAYIKGIYDYKRIL